MSWIYIFDCSNYFYFFILTNSWLSSFLRPKYTLFRSFFNLPKSSLSNSFLIRSHVLNHNIYPSLCFWYFIVIIIIYQYFFNIIIKFVLHLYILIFELFTLQEHYSKERKKWQKYNFIWAKIKNTVEICYVKLLIKLKKKGWWH